MPSQICCGRMAEKGRGEFRRLCRWESLSLPRENALGRRGGQVICGRRGERQGVIIGGRALQIRTWMAAGGADCGHGGETTLVGNVLSVVMAGGRTLLFQWSHRFPWTASRGRLPWAKTTGSGRASPTAAGAWGMELWAVSGVSWKKEERWSPLNAVPLGQ
jgi:hypothetical protein